MQYKVLIPNESPNGYYIAFISLEEKGREGLILLPYENMRIGLILEEL